MRESASGSRTPQGSDAFSPTSQLGDFADDEAQWNNFIRVADLAARNALTTPELRDGILVETLDNHIIWQWFAGDSVWKVANASVVFCSLSLSANQILTTAGTFYAVSWDVETSDGYSMHSSGNPTRISAPVAGVYEVTGQMYVSESSGTSTQLKLRTNGSTDVRGSFTRVVPTSGAGGPLQIVMPVVLAAGDYIEVMVAAANNGSVLVGGSNNQSAVVTMKYLGPA